MNNINFKANLIIDDPYITKEKKEKYDFLSKKFSEETERDKDYTITLTKLNTLYDYDKISVSKNGSEKDAMNIKGLEKVEDMPVNTALKRLVKVFDISKYRIGYDEMISSKDKEIQKLQQDKETIRNTKKIITRVNMPKDVEYSEFYTIV